MHKNRDFFFLQYNKINWKNQEETKINYFINNYIIEEILLKDSKNNLSIFDIGFGVGYFMKMVLSGFQKFKKAINIKGCEPSKINFDYFDKNKPAEISKIYNSGFLETVINEKFDYVTSIYVFPHFILEDLELVVKKIKDMLNDGGKFILVLADEEYLKDKLSSQKDLFIESGQFEWNNKTYEQVLHYTDIPKIGKIIDYNRSEQYYIDLFNFFGMKLDKKENLNDNGFLCSLFIFSK